MVNLRLARYPEAIHFVERLGPRGELAHYLPLREVKPTNRTLKWVVVASNMDSRSQVK